MDKIKATESIIDQLQILEDYLLFQDGSLDDRERLIEGGEVCKMKEKLEQIKEYWESEEKPQNQDSHVGGQDA